MCTLPLIPPGGSILACRYDYTPQHFKFHTPGKEKVIDEIYVTIRSFETKLALFKLQLKKKQFFSLSSNKFTR